MPLRKSDITPKEDNVDDTKTAKVIDVSNEDVFAKYRTGPNESISDPKADNDVPEHISVEPDEEGKGPKAD